MKNGSIWLAITTILLLTVVLFSSLNFEFHWVFLLVCVGQALLIISVYRILKDTYTTDKTFDDFYEDFPANQ